MQPLIFVTEPLLSNQFVQYRLVVSLAKSLRRDFDITLAAPAIAESVREEIEEQGLSSISANAWFPRLRSVRDETPSFAVSWARDALIRSNGRRMERLLRDHPGLRVNFSMTTSCHSDLWYVQGRPIGPTLRAIAPSLKRSLRIPAQVLGPGAALLDNHHVQTMANHSKAVFANSDYLKTWFRDAGIPVAGTLPSCIFTTDFAPTTSNPRRDYALVYLGKETELSTVRSLIRSGIPVKLFGGKSGDWLPDSWGREPNLDVVGYVSKEELRELYTNALFTAFPFTEEPFGLVPIESMACGTPVLTYRKQGPGESVVDGETGWLVDGPGEFQLVASRIFANTYPESWSQASVERSRQYHPESVTERWARVLGQLVDGLPLDRRSARMEPFASGQRFLPSR
ncbi:MAG TPA: glycosyltransferase family 4 protein [Thermoplasmata archaeon]|nr:glycosyltransferase family 4 protein [Thermoplasmata archaeon]